MTGSKPKPKPKPRYNKKLEPIKIRRALAKAKLTSGGGHGTS